jgi:RHS repeat-associated protein
MGTTTYTTFNGMLVHENRGGVETEYVPDTLGSVMMCRDVNGNTIYTADYQPYGEIASNTGTNPSPWGFVGTLGYYTDSVPGSVYVRARFLSPSFSRWLTLDPIWPAFDGYIYIACSPLTLTDRLGLAPALPDIIRCDKATNDAIYRYCYWCNTVGLPTDPGCQEVCNTWASAYYSACGKQPKHTRQPGDLWMPMPGVGIAPFDGDPCLAEKCKSDFDECMRGVGSYSYERYSDPNSNSGYPGGPMDPGTVVNGTGVPAYVLAVLACELDYFECINQGGTFYYDGPGNGYTPLFAPKGYTVA